MWSHKDLDANVFNSFIHNRPKLKTTQTPTKWSTDTSDLCNDLYNGMQLAVKENEIQILSTLWMTQKQHYADTGGHVLHESIHRPTWER